MDQHSSRQGMIHLRVAAASLGAAALFVFSTCCFPLNALAAVPCAQLRARLGPLAGWLSALLAGLFIALLTGPLYGAAAGAGLGLAFITVVALPALAMTGWVLRGVRPDHAAVAGFFCCLLFLAGAFLVFTARSGSSPGELVNQVNRDYVEMMNEELESGRMEEVLGKPFADYMRRELHRLESPEARSGFLGDFFFAILGIWFLTGLSLVVTIMSRSRVFGAPERFTPLDNLRVMIPDLAVFPFIICGLLTLVRVDALRWWCYNILIILAFMYFLCGLSIFGWFIGRMGMPLVFKVLITLFVLTWPPFLLLLAGVGLFDQWFDFRKLRVPGAGGPPGPPAGNGEDTDD